MRIALTGNPNSGKTTMYNALTGRNEKVGNWAGVTVEKKTSPIKKSFQLIKEEMTVVDLPGAYSMSPFTSEESITSKYVQNEKPDVLINIVDATNLSRSLFFTTQLLELGIPTVVALNKTDINQKKETKIDTELLAKILGCPVIETISTHNGDKGLKKVVKAVIEQRGKWQSSPYVENIVDLSNKDSVTEADKKRFEFVNDIVDKVETRKILTKNRNRQDKIDSILVNKWLGIPIFAVVMFAVFWLSQAGPGVWIADLLVGWLETLQTMLGDWVISLGSSEIVKALLIDGVIGGLIAVIGFLPLVMIMYFLIALLEDCGYMARVSVVLDPIFKKVGLSGKSVIPFVIGTGCAIPGVMACRTIRNERERKATAMLTPLMPCGAKLPVISLFASVFFENASWIGTLMYFASIIIIFFGALLINKITGYKARKSFFIIELPEYKTPNFLRAFKSMCGRGWEFVVKAATIILICNTVVQIMQSFNWSFQTISDDTASTSILATIAHPIAYVLIPIIGKHVWQMAAATVTGFIAKENIVGSLAVCYGIADFFNKEELALAASSNEDVFVFVNLSKVAALAFLMFNLFSPPCFAAIGAMNAEMKSAKWLWGGIALQLGIGFTVAYLVNTIGTLIVDAAALNVAGAIGGGIAVAVFVAIIVCLCMNSDKKLKAEYALK